MPLVFASPPISLSTAHAFATFFTFSYVGSLYISKTARLSFKKGAPLVREGQERPRDSEERWRNDPDVIRARLLAAGLSTVISVLAVFFLVRSVTPNHENARDPSTLTAFQSTMARLGFTLDFAPSAYSDIVLPCLVAPALFLGPLYADYLSSALPLQQRWSFRYSFMPLFSTWVGVRNYIIGPITEEVVFRGCMLAVYHMAGTSRTRMIFLSPLAFGTAHLHHAWDTYNRYGRTSTALRIAVIQTLFQLAYSSLFGFHCAFLFLRTGSLLPPVVSHIFCNVMGFPQYALHIRMFPKRRLVIQAAYLLGIIGYVYTMRWWTQVDDSLFWPAPGQPGRY